MVSCRRVNHATLAGCDAALSRSSTTMAATEHATMPMIAIVCAMPATNAAGLWPESNQVMSTARPLMPVIAAPKPMTVKELA